MHDIAESEKEEMDVVKETGFQDISDPKPNTAQQEITRVIKEKGYRCPKRDFTFKTEKAMNLLDELEHWTITHVLREKNEVADHLAKGGRKKGGK